MLKKITIENYKSYKKQEFSLSDLTIISGQNSSGKSSLIETLLILGQSSEPNLLNAHLKNIGKFETIKNNSTTIPYIYFKYEDLDNLISEITIKSDDDAELTIENKSKILYLSAERIAVQPIYKSDNKNNSFDSKGEYLISLFNNQRENRSFIEDNPKSFERSNWIIQELNLKYYDANKIDASDESFTGKPTIETLINLIPTTNSCFLY